MDGHRPIRPFCKLHNRVGFQEDCADCHRLREAEGRALQTYRENQLAANAKINKMEQTPPWPTWCLVAIGVIVAIMAAAGSCIKIQ